MIRRLLHISRPRFWLYLGGTYLVGYTAGAGGLSDFARIVFPLSLLYFLVPANVFLYGVNDLFDEDTDEHNPKKGAQEHLLERGHKREVAIAVIVTAVLGVGVALMGSHVPGGTRWVVLFTGAFLLLGAGYSVPPVRFKARPFFDFSSNVLYATPAFVGYAQITGLAPPGVAVVGAFCWTGAMHLLSAVPDIDADRSAGLATTATVLGERASLVLCALLWLFAAAAAWQLVPRPVGALALVYPLAALALVARPSSLGRAYWAFPYLNAAAGFVLFLAAVPM